MKFSFWTSLSALTYVVAAASNVIELTDKNFDSVVIDSKIPTIVDIYASWCGHCKRLNPVYEELADTFSHAKDKVQIVKIDGDANRKVAKKYKVSGFPTIKFINSDGSVEDVNVGRDLDSLANYLTDKVPGLKRKFNPPKPSFVTSLTEFNFDEIVGDKEKAAIVAFTANWCGHCKSLKPIFKEVAEIFQFDNDRVVIGEVDTTGPDTAKLAARFSITSYPTILVFPRGEGIPEDVSHVQPYKGPRSVEGFIDTINNIAQTYRTPEGGLTEYAGRFKKLDRFASKFVKSTPEQQSFLKEKIVQFMANANKDKQLAAEEASKIYLKFADKISASEEYLEKELKRLGGIVSRGGLKKAKLDELTKKLNILKTFVPGHVKDEDVSEQKEEKPAAEKAKDEL